jgi:hypothetical protein
VVAALVVAEVVALDLDVLAALVAIALVAAVVAELEPQHARHRRAQLDRGERQWWCAAVVAELEPPHARHRRAQLDPAPWWWRCGGRASRRARRGGAVAVDERSCSTANSIRAEPPVIAVPVLVGFEPFIHCH